MSYVESTSGLEPAGIATATRLVKRVPLAPGDRGVEQTIAEMRQLVWETGGKPVFKDIAMRLVPLGAAVLGEQAYRQLFNSLRHTFRYVRDARGVEEIWEPECHAYRFASVGHTWGDCDDAAVWAATLISALNLAPFRWVTIATGRRGLELDHVFVEVQMNGIWKTFDFLAPGTKSVRTVYWRA